MFELLNWSLVHPWATLFWFIMFMIVVAEIETFVIRLIRVICKKESIDENNA